MGSSEEFMPMGAEGCKLQSIEVCIEHSRKQEAVEDFEVVERI